MATYYVHRYVDAQNDHEVHRSDCYLLQQHNLQNFVNLGDHPGCYSAVLAARRQGYTRANGCVHCARECHTH